jgi:hypothetical protein
MNILNTLRTLCWKEEDKDWSKETTYSSETQKLNVVVKKRVAERLRLRNAALDIRYTSLNIFFQYLESLTQSIFGPRKCDIFRVLMTKV